LQKQDSAKVLELIAITDYYARLICLLSNREVSMKPKFLLVILVVLVSLMSGCKFGRGIAGSGNRKTEKRELKSFNAIDTSGAYEVNVTCQKPASFEVEADDNILPLIKTEVRDGTLFVSSDQQFNSSKGPMLRITLPDLSSVASHGAGEVKIADANSSDLKIESTGAANMNASGKARSVTISSTGAGNIDSSKLTAEKATVKATGAANVDVYASEQLDVTVSGVGSVTYSGSPKVVNKKISGIGSVNPKN
jgi:Putative auto-transporter adhesin, head GIN domain